MKLHAFVLHNVSLDMFFRYEPKTSELHHAHTFQIEADNLDRAADLIWILTNVDSADMLRTGYPHLAQYADQQIHYRQRKNRSLSVGDVIVFYERERPAGSFVVASVGFDKLVEFDPTINMKVVSNDRPESDSFLASQRFALTHRGR